MDFSLEQAMSAMSALRKAVDLPEKERFPLRAFVGMLSDEIEATRNAGKTDDEIVAIIQNSSGALLSTQELAENYATPEQRERR